MFKKKVQVSLLFAYSISSLAMLPLSYAATKVVPRSVVPPVAIESPPLVAKGEQDASPNKPRLETLLKPRSITKVTEDSDIVTNSEWLDNSDFAFVNAAVIRTPQSFARPLIVDFSLYPKMSSAIKKWEYNPTTQIIEAAGEAAGLHMHSWIKIDQRYWDEIHFNFIRGDLAGFSIKVFLWDRVGGRSGRTLIVGKGVLPEGRKLFSAVIALIFKPASEVVIGVATKNFRSYIEEEYNKKKSQKP